jgi:hypothetical protein
VTYDEALEAHRNAQKGYKQQAYYRLRAILHERLKEEVAKKAGKVLHAHYSEAG